MEDLIIFWKVLLAIISGFGALWGAVKVINEIRKPRLQLEKNVEELEREVNELKDEVHTTQSTQKESNEALLTAINKLDKKIDDMTDKIHEESKNYSILSARSLLAIGNHLISGNDVHKIQDANEKLVNFLMEK